MSLPMLHRVLGMAGALWLAAQTSTLAGQEPAPAISWQASYQQALEQACATGKLVLIAINLTGEEASDDFADNIYHSRRIVKEAAGYVSLVACAQTHAEVEAADGSGRMICTRFGSVSCADHIAVERAVRDAFFPDQDEIVAPQHILLLSSGKPIAMRGWWMEERKLEKLLAEARTAARQPQSADRLEKEYIRGLIERAGSSGRERRDDAMTELTMALSGWSGEMAIELVRTRASAQVRQALVTWLAEIGDFGETALLALLDDPLPGIRQQVVNVVGQSLSDRARERLARRLSIERDQRVRSSIRSLLPVASAAAVPASASARGK